MPATYERPDPDTILAHVALIRAVDHCLADAEELRQWREELARLTRQTPAPDLRVEAAQ